MPPGYVPYQQQMSGPNIAPWGARAIGLIVNALVGVLFYLPGIVLGLVADILGLLLYLAGAVAYIVLYCKQVGTTGQFYGHKVAGVKIVDQRTGMPIGAGRAFVRQLATILNSLPCYVGWLWPLWDKQKQTFHDKVTSTYSIKV